MTFNPASIGFMQAAGLEASLMASQSGIATNQAGLIEAESIAPASYSLLDDGSKLRYVVGGLGVVTLATALGGCQAPQPAARNHEAQIPPNQQSCANSHSEFCRALQRTEQRVDQMREGRDEYNNHNQSLFWMAGAGGALTTALVFAAFFGVRSLRRKARAKAEGNGPKTAV